MARQRDKSPSLMDADFPMRRHGIQICAENEQSQTSRAVVAEEEEDDDVVFLHETKKKKPSRSNSSSSSTTGSENNNVVSAVNNMDKNVSSSKTTRNNNSWSSESSVDVGTESPPPRAPNANNQVGNEEEEIIIIHEKMGSITRPVEPPRCGDKRPSSGGTSLPVVDFETDPEKNSTSRKRGKDPSSQSYFLDKRRKDDEAELPSWLREGGEGITYERRPKTRWDNPSGDSQNTPVHVQELQFNPTETQSNPSTIIPQDRHKSNNNTTTEAWTPITVNGPQMNVAHVQNPCGISSDVPQAHRHVIVASASSQANLDSQSISTQVNQESDVGNGRGDASLGQTNGLAHEGRSKERERHSSGNNHKNRSRSRSRSLERRIRDSRNRSRSRERRKSRSPSPSRERRERRPSGSSYANHNTFKERRVSGNSNHSFSSRSSERGWKNYNERWNNPNYRGRGAGNGRCTPQSGTSKNYHKPRNENYNKYGNQEWLYNNRGGYRKGNKWGNDSGFRNDLRDNTNAFARGQGHEFYNANPNEISPNFIPSNIRSSWGNGQNSNVTAPNYVLPHTRQVPETEISISSQRNDNLSSTRLDSPLNVQPQPDKEDNYAPISHTKQRIAHTNAMGSATPASSFNAEQARPNPDVPINSTQTRKPAQTNSTTTNESTRNPCQSHSGKSAAEILRLIKTCPTCYGRMFDDRKKARVHLQKDHKQKWCYVCFKPISIIGIEYKQHFMEHTNDDPEELAQCALCHEKHRIDGMYIHLAKQHFIPVENTKAKPTGDRFKQKAFSGAESKIFSQNLKTSSWSGSSYQNDRRREQNQRIQQFDPQRSSTPYTKPRSRCKIDRNRQQVVDSELSDKSDASSAESDRNGNDVEHNLIHAPREDIRSFRIPKKKTGAGS